jgi:alcohol dehydrogenase
MEALVYHGPGQRAWESVPDPELEVPTDAVVRIDAATICGTDLHILKGDVPDVEPGTILGHEAVGTIEEIGSGVTSFVPGDRVLLSCITACGRCRFCKEARYGLCTGGGGWILGHLIDGVQAEYARIPFVDTSAYLVPEGLADEQVLFLADILPTSYEVGILNGRVKPGDVVAIVGAGPIGLAAVLTAKLYTPATIVVIDLAAKRLELATGFGADVTIDSGSEDPIARIMELTDGLGVDVAIEAVGVSATFELCTEIVRPGGTVANVGVHGAPATLHLEKLWIKGVTITTGLVDTFTTPTLLKLIAQGRLDTTPFATHRFKLSEAMEAYDVFGSAAETNALKVVLEGEKAPLSPRGLLESAVA